MEHQSGMGVISCNELWPGRVGKIDYTRRRTYSRVYEVYTDNPTIEAAVVIVTYGGPPLYQSYPYDLFAICTAINPKQDEADPLRWLVQVDYDSHPVDKKLTQPDGSSKDPSDDPTQDPPVWKFYFQEKNLVLRTAYQRNPVSGNNVVAATYNISSATWAFPGITTITTTSANDVFTGEFITLAGLTPSGYNGSWTVVNVISPTQFTVNGPASNPGGAGSGGTAAVRSGNSVAVVNSAGVPFDPPVEYDNAYFCCSVTGKVPYVDLSTLPQLKNSVNLTNWKGWNPRCVRCFGVEATTGWKNNIPYLELAYNLAIKEDTWDLRILDCGYEQILNPGTSSAKLAKIILPGGREPSAPVLLDGNGGILPLGNPPVFLLFNAYKQREYNTLIPW